MEIDKGEIKVDVNSTWILEVKTKTEEKVGKMIKVTTSLPHFILQETKQLGAKRKV